MQVIKYKSPVFAVFPFEQPDVFSYPKPRYDVCDQFLLKSIKQLEDDQQKGLSKKKPKKTKKQKAEKTEKAEKGELILPKEKPPKKK
uniref:Uncharacterized protein n=1 Tax=Trepomonas sp. PC1 TaxID=1076344 RepID=A0A146KA72_9EUKA|eukprot:JAP93762.1 hypothetical protein TPC1_13824 [Trepomonas sp. PC1]